MIAEREHLLPLAESGFDLAEISFPRVDGWGCVRCAPTFLVCSTREQAEAVYMLPNIAVFMFCPWRGGGARGQAARRRVPGGTNFTLSPTLCHFRLVYNVLKGQNLICPT